MSLLLKLCHEFMKPWEFNSDIFAPVFLSDLQRPLCSVLAKGCKITHVHLTFLYSIWIVRYNGGIHSLALNAHLSECVLSVDCFISLT